MEEGGVGAVTRQPRYAFSFFPPSRGSARDADMGSLACRSNATATRSPK